MTVSNGSSKSGNISQEERARRFPLGPQLLEQLLEYLRTRISGCLGAGLTIVARDTDELASIGIAAELARLQWELDEGPTVLALTKAEATSSDDLLADERWPRLAAKVSHFESAADGLACVVLSGSWDDEGPIVLTVYLDHAATADDLRALDEVEPMLAMSAAMVEFCTDEMLRTDQLLGMVEHRRVIEQAKGMIMAVRRCDASTAFRMLVTTSQHFNVKLRDLAVATVEVVGGEPAEEMRPEMPGVDARPIALPSDASRNAANQLWAALREN